MAALKSTVIVDFLSRATRQMASGAEGQKFKEKIVRVSALIFGG